MSKPIPAIVISVALFAAGCGNVADRNSSGGDTTVVVFAAASLTETFTQLGRTFEAQHKGVRVKFNFAGSSGLAQQIVQGAPADVFAAASPATMKQLGGRARSPKTFARNRLEIAVPPANPGRVRALRDLARPGLKVVLCAPQVPCGAAARTVLAGLKVTPVSQEQDVKAALTKVRLNEADAALVYRTDVRAAGRQVTGIDFPESAKAINDYPIATVAGAPHRRAAEDFVRLVLASQATLTGAGFEKP